MPDKLKKYVVTRARTMKRPTGKDNPRTEGGGEYCEIGESIELNDRQARAFADRITTLDAYMRTEELVKAAKATEDAEKAAENEPKAPSQAVSKTSVPTKTVGKSDAKSNGD